MYKIDHVVYKKNQKLKRYNTFKVKSISKHFFVPETIGGLKNLLSVLKEKKKDFLILGGGSNVLFVDEIIEKPIIYMGYFSRIIPKTGGLTAYSGATVKWLVSEAKKNNLTGIEVFSGLPGTVGGACFMNARCYGHSISEFIESVGVIDENNEYRHLKKEELNYSYKKSIFQDKKLLIVDVIFKLESGNRKDISKKMKEHYKDRKDKNQYKYPSAGCVFLNDYTTNMVAGKVIEELGLKGISLGGACVSPYHANFIINKNNASGKDIYGLMKKVEEEVFNKKNIKLNTEIRIIKNE